MVVRFLTGLLRLVEEGIPALFMGMMVVIIVADVFGRYVLNSPIAGAAELATALFLWVIFLGGAGAMRRHLHVSIKVLVSRLPERWQAAAYLVSNLALASGMLILVPLAWSYAVNNRRIILLLQLPYRFIYMVIAVGLLLIAVHAMVNAGRILPMLVRGGFRPPAADQDYGVPEDTRPLFQDTAPEHVPIARQPS